MKFILDFSRDISISLGFSIYNRKSKLRYLHYFCIIMIILSYSAKIFSNRCHGKKRQELEEDYQKRAEEFRTRRVLEEKRESLEKQIREVEALLEEKASQHRQ